MRWNDKTRLELAARQWGCRGKTRSTGKETIAMALILLWLLGAPLTLILILFLLGVGR
jgi:hypothetical protein